MGYQQWTTGQVLTSTAMNQVGDSTVNVFASSSARSSAAKCPPFECVGCVLTTKNTYLPYGRTGLPEETRLSLRPVPNVVPDCG